MAKSIDSDAKEKDEVQSSTAPPAVPHAHKDDQPADDAATPAKRNVFKRIWNPDPAPPAFGQGHYVPDQKSSIISQVIFSWFTPMLFVGFSRTLESDDLWEMNANRQATEVGNQLESAFYERCAPRKRPEVVRRREEGQPHPNEKKGSDGGESAGTPADDDLDEEEDDEQAIRPTTRDSDSSSATDAEKVRQDNKEAADAIQDDVDNAGAAVGGPTALGASNGPVGMGRMLTIFARRKGAEKEHTTAASPRRRRSKKNKKPKYDESLTWALHSVLWKRFWLSGFFKFIGDGLLTTSPLVSKALINYLSQAYAHAQAPGIAPPPPSQAVGWGLAIGLWAMQQASSLATNQFYYQAMQCGFLARTAVISNIFRKALRLSAKSRLAHTTGQLTTAISADASRVDMSAGFAHNAWLGPLQVLVSIALLIANLRESALVALGVLVFGTPIQAIIVSRMISARRSTVKITDKRVRLMQEVFMGMKYIILFEHRDVFAERITGLRRSEIYHIRRLAFYRALTFALVYFVPVAAAVLSFATYKLIGNDLNPAIVFSSLQYINILRMTLVLAPLAMSSLGDAHVALGRIGKILLADEIGEDYPLNDDMGVRIHGDFTWESVGPPSSEANGPKAKQFGKSKADAAKEKAEAKLSKEELAKKKAEEKTKKAAEKERKAKVMARRKARRAREEAGEDVYTDDEVDDADELGHHLGANEMTPFMLKDLDLEIPKGRLVVVCGPVGSGKSALLQAMAGEMRKVKGTVAFGGRVAYHPQHPWIQNLTLRDNVLFGAPDDPRRFDEVVEACALRQDISMLPNGEKTELGERGVTISGGQKARVSLARVAYNDADVILLDDPIAAVDAHVGRHILHRCILTGPMANKTRVLVTHALHVFPFADEIIYMEDGRIVEQGAYTDLVQANGHFAKLIEEHGGEKEKADDEGAEAVKGAAGEADKNDGPQQHLMVDEERETGAVKGEVYAKYLKAAGSPLWFPFLLALLTITQVSQVGNNLLLGFWSRESIPGWTEGQYLGLYAGFGISQAIFTFFTSFAFSYAGFHASLYLFMRALGGVVSSPLAFHDTTPVGRIISRLSKDVDTLDFQLPSNGFSFSLQASSVLGTIGLTIYAYNWLGLMFPPLFLFYYIVQTFYRRTSREAKRLDSLLRSFLYASYMEALNGISTVRAFRMQDRFVSKTEKLVDSNNTAYLLTIAAQRWLSVRMDVLGNTVILGIGLAAVGFRTSQSPATLGVVLTYALSITQSLSMIVQQLAQLEQDMNVVERVLYYSELPREGDATREDDPPESWPSAGAIEFDHVELRYRPELPLVLKGVNISIKPGERVGIIGRTGSGKSSLLAALWHTVPLAGGRILIDGVDIADVGLATLRQRMSIVPQDTTIFDTTLRDNIDPTGKASDAEMYAALRAVGLLDASSSQAPSGTATPAVVGGAATTDGTPLEGSGKNRFHLDTECREDSYSSGQKQLIGLARALVKRSRIVVLDEATASVDVEADARVQHMIQTLRGRTLLCIAHRLNTVVYSDRVLVMGDGQALEFDEPLALFDRPGSAFRAMCDQASLTRENIEKIRANAALAQRHALELEAHAAHADADAD